MASEEAQRQQRAAAAAPGQRQFAAEESGQTSALIRGDLQRARGDRQRVVRPPPGSGRRRPGARPSARRTGRAGRRRAAPAARPAATAGRGLAISRASASRRRWPAESLRTCRSSSRREPQRAGRRRAPSLVAAGPARLEQQLVPGGAARASGRPGGRSGAASRPRASSGSSGPPSPRNATSPARGRIRPAMARSRLVLPAPLRPVSADGLAGAPSSRSRSSNSARSPRATRSADSSRRSK